MKFQAHILQIAGMVAICAVAQAQQARPAHKPPAHKQSKTQAAAQAQPIQPSPAQAAPAPVVPPPTPEQGPSSPPQVSYQTGQLTIEARNSTMGDVLNAVKQKTGAAVEMPASSSERVVGRFGPGAPRDVLAQLLNGSHYDYVLLGSPADPGALKKIVLMARAVGPEPAPAQQQNSFGQNQNLQAVPEVENDQNTAEDTSGDVPAEVQQPEDQSQVPDQSLQQDQQQPGQNGAVVKTPEQLLRELQEQQRQQQQQQQPNTPQPQ